MVVFSQDHDTPLPSIEEPKGDYPTYITQESGKVVPVVQVNIYRHLLKILVLLFLSRLTATQSTSATSSSSLIPRENSSVPWPESE